jgi:hypothetical protein
MERASRQSRRWAKREIKARKRGTYTADKQLGGGAVVTPLRAKRKPRRPRRVPSWFIAAVVVLTMVGLASTTDLWWPRSTAAGSHSPTAAGKPGVVPPMYATATPTASPSPAPTTTIASFVGSPVEAWADGAAGLVAPIARPLPPFSRSQEADAFQRTVAYLRAAALDPRVVFGGQLTPIAKTLGAYSYASLLKASKTPTADDSALHWVTRFDGRLIRSESHVIKVNGSMHARTHANVLSVDYDYAFVYDLAEVRTGAIQLVSVRRTGTLVYLPALGNHRDVREAILGRGGYIDSGKPCHMENRTGFLPVVFDRRKAADPAAEPTTTLNPLDVRRPVPSTVGCFTDTSGL